MEMLGLMNDIRKREGLECNPRTDYYPVLAENYSEFVTIRLSNSAQMDVAQRGR